MRYIIVDLWFTIKYIFGKLKNYFGATFYMSLINNIILLYIPVEDWSAV